MPESAPQPAKGFPWFQAISLFALVSLSITIGLRPGEIPKEWAWVIILFLMTAFVVVTGKWLSNKNRWIGFLIDPRNKMSLSRLQMVGWTLIVLSSFFAAALFNISSGEELQDPLAIAIPAELWIAMGISTTSLIGSPLLLDQKRRKKAHKSDEENLKKQGKEMGIKKTCLHTSGQVVWNESEEDASWADLFRGEEVGNALYLDLKKIQMFFFTFVLLVAYAASILVMFRGNEEVITSLPGIGEGMTALLGISHTGYLAGKALPNSKQIENPNLTEEDSP